MRFSILVSYFDEVKRESADIMNPLIVKSLMLKMYLWRFVNCLTERKFYEIILYQMFLIVLVICLVKK